MKKLFSALISAALIATPLALVSTSAAAAKPAASKKQKKGGAKVKKVRRAAPVAQ